jgi:vacuolar-type H+-ATPase subunit E/Vma4
MSVEGIIERIMSEAKAQAKSITDDAEKQAISIEADNRREAEEYFHRARSGLEEQFRREAEREILSRRLAQRKAILQAKQDWMEKAFSEAYRHLLEQPLDEYRKIIKDLIRKVSTSKDEEIIFGTKGEERELRKIVDELNKEDGAHFTMSRSRGDFPWGFIMRRGRVEVNLSIDSLFRYKRNDLEQRAWELFNAGAES